MSQKKTATPAKKKKRYRVVIDMKYSIAYEFSATNKREAKKKAWEKLIKKIPKSIFDTYIDQIDF